MIVGLGLLATALSWAEDVAPALDPSSIEAQVAMLAFAVVLLGLGLLQIPLGRRLDRSLLGPAPPAPSAFRGVDLPFLVGVYVLAQVFVTVAYGWAKTGDLEPPPEFFDELGALEVLGITALGQAIPAAIVVGIAWKRSGGAAALGIRRPTPGARTSYAVGRYVLALPMLFGLIALTSFLFVILGFDPPAQDAALLVRDGLGENPVAIALFVAVLIPLLEEILFRGLLLELCVSAMGRLGGIVVSSAVFGALHGAAAFLPIFGLALVLSVVKLRTRSLAAVWLIHGLHNGAMTLLLHLGVTLEAT
ncbi:MAG: CPBP family intramembrane glutamic endopeptidase [Planctomycetota bacterium]